MSFVLKYFVYYAPYIQSDSLYKLLHTHIKSERRIQLARKFMLKNNQEIAIEVNRQ